MPVDWRPRTVADPTLVADGGKDLVVEHYGIDRSVHYGGSSPRSPEQLLARAPLRTPSTTAG
jgi:hypothetical protein